MILANTRAIEADMLTHQVSAWDTLWADAQAQAVAQLHPELIDWAALAAADPNLVAIAKAIHRLTAHGLCRANALTRGNGHR